MMQLRDATEDDRAFIFSVRRAAFRPYEELSGGWREEEQRRLLEQRLADQRFRIITVDDIDVGYVATAVYGENAEYPAGMYLHQLMVAPDQQSRGIGAWCLEVVSAEAQALGLPLRLRVLKVNPGARTFYERNGFEVTNDSDTHWSLEREEWQQRTSRKHKERLRELGTEFFDPVHLRSDAYADANKLLARVDIYRFQHPQIDFGEWALSHLPERLDAVLDVGCGPGSYLRRLAKSGRASSLVGIDLSAGILAEALDVDASLCVGDAQALPFDDESFDTTLVMHMLYHVEDIHRAISEIRRVTKQGGTALIATNGSEHQRALREVFDASVAEVSSETVSPILGTERRFRLEEGEPMLRAHFDSVERHDLPRELVLTDPVPIVAYLNSIRSFHASKLPGDVSWDKAVERFRRHVEEEIIRSGSFRSSTRAGVFVCS